MRTRNEDKKRNTTQLRKSAAGLKQQYSRSYFPAFSFPIYHPVPIKPKKKRWGLGLQAGYGYPGGFYVGGGISYDLFQW